MTAPVRLDNLVVGVDDSPESLYALDLAAGIGINTRATITVVHVRPRPVGLALGSAGAVEYERAEDDLDAEVARIAGEHLSSYPGVWTVSVRHGNVAQELLAVADSVDADLVVVGHRSRGHRRLQDDVVRQHRPRDDRRPYVEVTGLVTAHAPHSSRTILTNAASAGNVLASRSNSSASARPVSANARANSK